MKPILILAVYLLLILIQGGQLYAQTGSWAYDYSIFDQGRMIEVLDGKVLLSCLTKSQTQSSVSVHNILLIDPNTGELEMENGIELDSVTIQIDRGIEHLENRFYCAGGINSYKVEDTSIYQMMISVFDEDLNSIRIIPFRDSTLTTFSRDLTIIDDKIYLWGQSGKGFTPVYYVLVCMDTLGQVKWHKRYKDDYQLLTAAFIEESHDGQLITTAMGQKYQERKTIVVRKIDKLGATIWKRDLGLNDADDNSCLARLGSNKYIVSTFKDTVFNAPDGQLIAYPSWIFVLDENGQITHDSLLGTPAHRRYNKAVSTKDGGALLVGYFILPFSQVAIMTKFDSMGHVQWDRYYRDIDRTTKIGSNDYRFVGGFFDVEVLPDGRIAASGMLTDSFINGANNIWLVVLDSVGCWMPGCEDGLQNTVITHITQGQERLPLHIYPNPSSGSVTLSSSLEDADPNGTIEVFDLQGRLSWQQKGIQPIQSIDLNNLPSGMYTLRLMTKTGYAVERLVLE